jgi:hypothetical protein
MRCAIAFQITIFAAFQPSALAANDKAAIELVYSRHYAGGIGLYIQDKRAKIVGGASIWSLIIPSPHRVVIFSKDNGTYAESAIDDTLKEQKFRSEMTTDTVGMTRKFTWSEWKRTGSEELLGLKATKWVRTALPNNSNGFIKSATDECLTVENYKISPEFRSLVCAMVRCAPPPSGLPISFSASTTFRNGANSKSQEARVEKIRHLQLPENDFSLPPGLKRVNDYWQVVTSAEDLEGGYQMRTPAPGGKLPRH